MERRKFLKMLAVLPFMGKVLKDTFCREESDLYRMEVEEGNLDWNPNLNSNYVSYDIMAIFNGGCRYLKDGELIAYQKFDPPIPVYEGDTINIKDFKITISLS